MTFRRAVSPKFAALLEENGVSLTDEETKGPRVKSTGRPVAGETRRRLKICLRNGKHKIQKVLGGAERL